eukprot:gene14841-17023_t
MDMEEMEGGVDADGTEIAAATNTADVSAPVINTTHHSYVGQGAYVDGPACFVDLEANVPGNNSTSGSSSSARKRRRAKRKLRKEQQKLVNILSDQPSSAATVEQNAGAMQGEVSDLSESSSASYERSAASGHVSGNGSNHSYATAGWYDLEPSDDSDVVYSLSSGEDENISRSMNSTDRSHRRLESTQYPNKLEEMYTRYDPDSSL